MAHANLITGLRPQEAAKCTGRLRILLEGRLGIIAMPRSPVGEPVGVLESNSPRQTPSPGEVESPPETPDNSDQAVAPPPSERQLQVSGDIITNTDKDNRQACSAAASASGLPNCTTGDDRRCGG
jgi:hypothetical protein